MKKSFTLIELLMVCAIFGIFALGAFDFFISQVTLQTQTLMFQQAFNELSFSIDKMSREIRMAKKDDIRYKRQTISCISGENVNFGTTTNGIVFRDYLNRCHEFFLQNSQIKECIGNEANHCQEINLPLTSNSTLVVQNLKFYLSGETQNDHKQPKVTILIDAKIRGKYEIPIKVQTTVSQADLDIEY